MLGFAALVFFLLHSDLTRTSSAGVHFTDALKRLELLSLDLRFRWRGAIKPSPQIAIVGIMQPRLIETDFKPEELAASEPLQAMVERDFPWRRSVHTALLEKLMSAGARVVVFDLIFAAETEDDPAFRAAIEKYRDRVVLGWTVQEVSGEDGVSKITLLMPNDSLLPEAPNITGYAFHQPDSDGTIRRVRHHTSALKEVRPDIVGPDDPLDMTGLAALAVERFNGQPPPKGDRRPIRYQGGAQTFNYLPIEEVFSESSTFKDDPRFAGGAVFRDKIVFFGPIYELAHDVHETPFGVMPGVEIHAQIASDLLSGSPLNDAPPWVGVTSTLVVLALATLIVLRVRRAALQGVFLVALGITFAAMSQAFFEHGSLVMVSVPPLFALVCTGSFGILFHFAMEQSERARVRSVLDRYVSKNVASLVVENSDAFTQSLRGEKRCVTVLFSDVRNFTTISESTSAENLVGQMNEYFLPMVDAVLQEGGTLQKFIGDAIMAVWGDTHTLGSDVDATRAVRSALAMRSGLVRLNAAWEGKDGRVAFTTGIGINHGEVLVGELGHPQRMEFTVLGDGVNLAARLESATKQFHTDILVGEKVEELTRDSFIYRRVDSLRFKGKTKPVEVYIPLAEITDQRPEWLENYHRAIAHYRSRKFAEAATLFAAVQHEIGEDDFLCGMYRQRCERFLEDPPADDWDGAHALSEK